MTDPKERPKRVIPTRTPGKRGDLFDGLRSPTPLPPSGGHPINEILGLGEPLPETGPVPIGPVHKEPVQPAPVRMEPLQSEPVPAEPVQTAAAPIQTSPHAKGTSQPVYSGPVQKPAGGGRYTQWPHSFWDDLAQTLDPVHVVVLSHLYRLTAGYQKRPTCIISLPKLAERANVSVNTARAATRKLEARKLIERVGIDNENTNGELRGIEWRMLVPFYNTKESDRSEKGTGPELEPMKETPKDSNETLALKFKIRQIALRLVPFTLDELRIALRGQGIVWDDDVVADAISVIQGREGG